MRKIIPSIGLVFALVFSAGLFAQGQHTNLPEDFPEIKLNVYDDPEPGYIFITPSGLWGYFIGVTPYLAIVDNYGTPVYYQELNTPAFDFKLQKNGMISFHGGGYGTVNHIMDSAYNIIGTRGVSGYSGTDFHEFRLRDDGSCLLLGWDDRQVDMSAVIPGGQPNATVRGTLVQEKDAAGNVLWEWSSWGHVDILDCDTAHVDLTGAFIDYIHTNAIDEDDDGNILLSSRNLHEITKIDKSSGNIIWRMGGSQNEFEFSGQDTLGFSGQHHIRKLENGHYLLFDNGWYHPEVVSSALELQLDEENKFVEVVKRYRSQPDDITGYIMGSSQRLPGGHTLVGWGSGVPNVTEFKPDGTKALELEFESVSYRAFKFPWKTNIFSSNINTINFGEIYFAASETESVTITNHHHQNIIVTGIHNHSGKYYCKDDLPLLITAGFSEELEIEFIPGQIGEYNDIITVYAEWQNQTTVSSFALQLNAMGAASEEASVPVHAMNHVRIYPNPATDVICISKPAIVGELEYHLSSTQGKHLTYGLIPAMRDDFQIYAGHLSGGVYILSLIEKNSGRSIYRKIIKN